jgi:predicted nucleic acid-binding protein
MKLIFVDANVFLRFFARDDEAQHSKARRLLRAAEAGKVRLITGPPVLFEVAWTLKSFYKRPRQEVLDALARIASLPGLDLIDRHLVQDAIRLAEATGQEFPDAYIATSARLHRTDGVATFNRGDFEKLGVTVYDFDDADEQAPQ